MYLAIFTERWNGQAIKLDRALTPSLRERNPDVPNQVGGIGRSQEGCRGGAAGPGAMRTDLRAAPTGHAWAPSSARAAHSAELGFPLHAGSGPGQVGLLTGPVRALSSSQVP